MGGVKWHGLAEHGLSVAAIAAGTTAPLTASPTPQRSGLPAVPGPCLTPAALSSPRLSAGHWQQGRPTSIAAEAQRGLPATVPGRDSCLCNPHPQSSKSFG